MQTKVEAPAVEPLSVAGTGVAVSAVERRFRASRRGKEDVEALAGVSLEVRAGQVVGVVGPSGCGKSTLLELVAGLQEPDAGTVEVAGASAAERRRAACSYMPQRDLLLPWRDALGNAALALECQGVPRTEAHRRETQLLVRSAIGCFEGLRPAQLSFGMLERVAFMRTVMSG